MFLVLLEVVFLVLVLAIILTQVLVPIAKGTKLFPAFRKSRNEVVDEIRELKEEQVDQQLRNVRDDLAANVVELKGRKRSKKQPPTSKK